MTLQITFKEQSPWIQYPFGCIIVIDDTPRKATDIYIDILNWLDDNLKGREFKEGLVDGYSIFFKHKKDLVKFKLVWDNR